MDLFRFRPLISDLNEWNLTLIELEFEILCYRWRGEFD